ncbi:MAG: T9SS type A sorting domain-containing protein, partial [Chlamydiia bacterium]|nr:T9SS type A sorting domain-containing protein [Chlamydiia bacterium]
WAATNNNAWSDWKTRRLPTDPTNHNMTPEGPDMIGTKGQSGMAYEWMIDLCNKTKTNLWINIPHNVGNKPQTEGRELWAGLSKLIAEKLDPELNCYVEYSNETWNPGFTQNAWIKNRGALERMPGADKDYKGGSYHVYISYQIFDAFQKSFEDAGRRWDLKKVIATGGNIDFVVKAIRDNDPKVNPLGQKADAFSIAPYIGGGTGNLKEDIDGKDPLVLEKQNEWLKNQINPTGGNPGATIGRVIQARQLADEFGMLLVAYEGGTHNLVHAEDWSKNPLIYDHYTNMLSIYEDYFDLFCHYTHTGKWSNLDGEGAWGSMVSTDSPLADAHKYRALKDWSEKFTLDPDAPILELEQGVAMDLKVYPNPVKDGNLTIESAMNKSSVVVVTNIMGQEIMRTDFKGTKLTISTTGFQKGLYFISIVSNNNISTQKIIVE